MTRLRVKISKSALASFLAFGLMSATALAADLSSYRDFQLGTDLSTVAKQAGMDPSQAKTIHLRPALIQELTWRPQPLGPSSKAEAVSEVLFSFYDGELFQITVNYDRYATEGLTTADIVEAISATYGMAAKTTDLGTVAQGPYGDQEEVLAQWQDPQCRYDLFSSTYTKKSKVKTKLKSRRKVIK